MERMTTRLRRLLEAPELLVAPGVAECVGARLVAEQGFDALYMTGAGTTASRLGMPDVGLLGVTEMADNAGRIADAADLPLIADADTGYGGPINVRRTIQCYERAGVAGVHMEDQDWPKRCGHLAGKTLIPAEEMCAKVRAAVDARSDPDFIVIARTDAIAVEGFEAALDRAKAYEEAGADVLFVEAPTTMEEVETIPKTFSRPTLYNMAMSGKTPVLPASDIEALGFGVVIYPGLSLSAAIPAIRRALAELRETGGLQASNAEMASFRDFFELMGLEGIQNLESRYAVSEGARVGFDD